MGFALLAMGLALAQGACPPGEACGDGASTVAMVLVQPGTFTMGSKGDEPGRHSDELAHTVRLTRPILVMKTEVTQGLYEQVVGRNPAKSGRRFYDGKDHGACAALEGVSLVDPSFPVICVSWLDAVAFANELSRRDGLEACYEVSGERVRWPKGLDCQGYRLPTEAEWEYVARGGRKTPHGAVGSSEALVCRLGNVADQAARLKWPSWEGVACDDRYAGLAPVGFFEANGFGVHDMVGNVWEWTWDLYGPYSSTPGEDVDPMGWTKGENRVHRGGAWGNGASDVRVANRRASLPQRRNINLGFRLVRTAG